jgi:hypothetical protein
MVEANMNSDMMLDFLMENSVHLTSELTSRMMVADEAFVLGGEFVVYEPSSSHDVDVYRGTDFETAMVYLDGKEE